MSYSQKISVCLFTVLIQVSCSTDNSITTNTTENTEEVYAVGRQENTSETSFAKIWTNDIATDLTSGGSIADAQDVFVYGDAVYVAGSEYEYEGNHYVAKIWKNGIATNLSSVLATTDATAYAVKVNADGVFACGYEKNNTGIWVAKYWDKGVSVPLTNGIENAYAKDMAVSNNTIYVVVRAAIDGHTKACLWKNNVLTELANSDYYSTAEAIFVDGNDIYVAGFKESDTNDIAMLWKNGVPIPLSANDSYAECVKVVDGKVYVGGWEHIAGSDVATIWIDGTPNYITDGSKDAAVYDIDIVGESLYAAGWEENEDGTFSVAKVWKNNEEISLTSGTTNAYATGIIVVNN